MRLIASELKLKIGPHLIQKKDYAGGRVLAMLVLPLPKCGTKLRPAWRGQSTGQGPNTGAFSCCIEHTIWRLRRAA